MAAEQRSAELESRAASADERALQAEARAEAATVAAASEHDGAPNGGGDERVAELERQIEAYVDELDQMGNRLRRAYADAEEARAALGAGGSGSSASGGADADEVARLRRELAQAIERASEAENRSSQLQADLAEARAGSGDGSAAPEVPEEEPEEEGPSLRYRLTEAAARKRGITGGGLNRGDDTPGSMWS
jgi:DNA repair exonuclease SbcCD ATPase subunit